MIKNKYVWFDQERVEQGSTSPLRDTKSLRAQHHTSLSFWCCLQLFQSRKPHGGQVTRRNAKRGQHGESSPWARLRGEELASSWCSWSSSCIRARRPWQSGCPPWLSACPWRPARRGCHSCGGTEGCPRRAASRGWPCSWMGWHCTSCKVTLGLAWRREAWLVRTRNCWRLGGHWVPERRGKGKEFLRE